MYVCMLCMYKESEEEEVERLQMAMEDDLQAIGLLSAQEKALRDVSLQYMQTFTQFQSKLQSSNEIFTVSLYVCMYVASFMYVCMYVNRMPGVCTVRM